ncbi:nitroreductase [Thermoflexus sp.]|uniref:nitroreductase family protein n=1 Tax=Thermoflexus sp. TaxID=1969742 RepID=UPI0035E4195B
MDVLEAIMTRRMVGKVRPERPKREEIETLLQAAVRAPNHRLTEPWRFVVIAGPALEELGEVFARILQMVKPDATEEELQRERTKPKRAPVIIAVACLKGRDPIETHENIVATAAAIQNILLAAHGMGLGAYLRTGDTAYHPLLLRWLGVPEDAQFMGLIYLGYPAPDAPPRHTPRRPIEEVTQWRGWAD